MCAKNGEENHALHIWGVHLGPGMRRRYDLPRTQQTCADCCMYTSCVKATRVHHSESVDFVRAMAGLHALVHSTGSVLKIAMTLLDDVGGVRNIAASLI